MKLRFTTGATKLWCPFDTEVCVPYGQITCCPFLRDNRFHGNGKRREGLCAGDSPCRRPGVRQKEGCAQYVHLVCWSEMDQTKDTMQKKCFTTFSFFNSMWLKIWCFLQLIKMDRFTIRTSETSGVFAGRFRCGCWNINSNMAGFRNQISSKCTRTFTRKSK